MKRCRIVYLSLNKAHSLAFENKARVILDELKKKCLAGPPEKDANSTVQEDYAKSKLMSNIELLSSPSLNTVYEFCQYVGSYSERLSDLYVIIDYVSLCGDSLKSCQTNSQIIQELILRYPEANFAFDEHLSRKEKCGVTFMDFIISDPNLSYKGLIVRDSVNKDVHSFDIDENDSFLSLCYYKDNLFDASNLRFALKAQKYHYLSVGKRNFERIQYSRATNLALIVEEEHSQSLFNCYSVFACGYRCLPVTTANGLIWANDNITPQIVFRDYDLQFPDEANEKSIHLIRGWQCKEHGERIDWKCTLDSNNRYWKNLQQIKDPYRCANESLVSHGLFYLSKGVEGLEIKLGGKYCIDSVDKKELCLPGIEKPISGIYVPFYPIVKTVYDDAVYTEQNSSDDYIDTGRAKGFHGAPLDIYYIVKSMVDRAQQYFDEKRFIHAAVLAQETIEVLNGFHESILIRAYHILAISENAIAMNTIGGSEELLNNDAIFRIQKIKYETERLLRRSKEKRKEKVGRKEFKYNIINQIFSGCRTACKNREHFSAEDSFISAMAHVNEGFTPNDIWDELLLICLRIKNSLEEAKLKVE